MPVVVVVKLLEAMILRWLPVVVEAEALVSIAVGLPVN